MFWIIPSDVIYLGGWIKYVDFISKNVLNFAPASLLARQLASANNIYLFSVWLWINIHICLRLVDLLLVETANVTAAGNMNMHELFYLIGVILMFCFLT